MILLLFLTFGFMLVLEAPKMLVKKQFKELIVFMGLWSLALLLAVLQSFHVKIPSPLAPVVELLKPLVPK